jgi:hypothetical protein
MLGFRHREVGLMAALQQDLDSRVIASARRAPVRAAALFTVDESADGSTAPSPARALQQRLSETLATPDRTDRWSGRSTLLFVVATCGGFWLVLGLSLMALRR